MALPSFMNSKPAKSPSVISCQVPTSWEPLEAALPARGWLVSAGLEPEEEAEPEPAPPQSQPETHSRKLTAMRRGVRLHIVFLPNRTGVAPIGAWAQRDDNLLRSGIVSGEALKRAAFVWQMTESGRGVWQLGWVGEMCREGCNRVGRPDGAVYRK